MLNFKITLFSGSTLSKLAQRRGFGADTKYQISEENTCIRDERHSSNRILQSNIVYKVHTPYSKKKEHFTCSILAQRRGFEPRVRFRTQPFQDCTIDHSDISAYNI